MFELVVLDVLDVTVSLGQFFVIFRRVFFVSKILMSCFLNFFILACYGMVLLTVS